MSALVAGVSVFAISPVCSAQTPAASATSHAARNYDIEAQPLSGALAHFARQSGLNALYPEAAVSPYRAPALHGVFTPEQALSRLLSASPLRGAISADGALVLDAPDNGVHALRDEPQDADAAARSNSDEIIVTGTRIRGAHPAGSNLTSLDRDDIEEAARNTLQDVLATLPQTFPGSQSDASQLGAPANYGRNIAFGSTVDLRGLGADATLTLVNGRRLAPAGFGNFTDVSAIPVAAIDHIDVLADGASATYGSDAIAGVVNVILRDDFNGAESSVHYGAATQGDPSELGLSQLFGASWRSGNVMAGYEYRHRSALASADRWFSATSDLRPWGGSNFSSTNTNPGNITRIGATNVVLAIPHNQDGTHLSEADLLPGVVNYRPFNQGTDLLPEQEANSVFASLHQDLTPALTLYANLVATRRDANSDRFQNNVTLVVPESNAYRQLGHLFLGQGPMRISYNMFADLGPSHFATRTEAYSGVVGLRYDLANRWEIDADLALSHNSDAVVQDNVFQSASLLTAALASGDLATAFNPFADGSNTNAAVLRGLTYTDFIDGRSQTAAYTLRADGPVFAIWGGDVRLAVGAERRQEDFELDHRRLTTSGTTSDIFVPPGSRTTDAWFGELYVPLVAPGNHIPLVDALDLSMSVRHEHASDYGDATTPKIGLTWAIGGDVSFRASWGQSFKAPQFQQLLGGAVGTIASIPPSLDPFATNGSTGILILGGTNSGLRPERAENWTAGFDLRPHWAPGLSLRATYFDIDFTDRISTPGSVLEALAHSTDFEGFFIRNPTPAQIDQYLALADSVVGSVPPDGIEAIFDGRLTNLASLRERGLDLSASFDFDVEFGHVQIFASGSELLQYTLQSGQGAPVGRLDTLFYPIDWRARAGATWTNDGWGASLIANYTDNYTDKISVPSRTIASQTTWDLRISRDWRTAEQPAGFQAALSIQNLLDEDPPFVNNPQGYAFDAQTASPIGRFVAVELRRTW
jgi:outer membrane receptor protein involved in Fe transport